MLKKLRGAFGRKEVSFAIGGTLELSLRSRARESYFMWRGLCRGDYVEVTCGEHCIEGIM